MKTMRKLFSVLLAFVMVMGLSVTAFAANDGSITIKNPTEGQTYTAYKIFDLTYSGTGDDMAYSYTATEEQKAFYVAKGNNPFAFEKNTVGTYNVSVGKKSDGTSYSDAEVTDFLQSFISTDANGNVTVDSEFAKVIGTGVTGGADGNNIKISNLEYGYYLVTSALGTVVTINSTTPDVTVKDKNGKPDADKDVKEDSNNSWADSNTAGIGDTVYFRTKVTIPVGSVNVVVHDDMTTGLTLNANSIKVYTDENLTTELDSGNYSVTTPTAPATSLTDGCEFEVSFTAAYLNGLNAETKVYVGYSAVVNEGAVIAGTGNTNTTKVSYGNDSSVESTPSTTTTYVWEFDLHKYANDDATGYLADAEFVLSCGEKYATFSKSSNGSTYSLTGWVDKKDDATRIVTTSTGKINIEGLDADTYQLTEVKAPDGYNSLGGPVTVVIAEDGKVSVNNTEVTEVSVQNQSGTELPSTGGMGTTIFYVVGSILVIGAAVLLITKKRMSGAEK